MRVLAVLQRTISDMSCVDENDPQPDELSGRPRAAPAVYMALTHARYDLGEEGDTHYVNMLHVSRNISSECILFVFQ